MSVCGGERGELGRKKHHFSPVWESGATTLPACCIRTPHLQLMPSSSLLRSDTRPLKTRAPCRQAPPFSLVTTEQPGICSSVQLESGRNSLILLACPASYYYISVSLFFLYFCISRCLILLASFLSTLLLPSSFLPSFAV